MNSIPELYVGKKQLHKVPLRDSAKSRSNVTDNPDSEARPTQATLEFSTRTNEEGSKEYVLLDEQKSKEEKDKRDKKLAERVRNLRETHEKLKEAGYSKDSRDYEIDEMENVPAYVRKKIKIDKSKHSESDEVSRYRLSDDEKDPPKLRPDNSYLHDNVD